MPASYRFPAAKSRALPGHRLSRSRMLCRLHFDLINYLFDVGNALGEFIGFIPLHLSSYAILQNKRPILGVARYALVVQILMRLEGGFVSSLWHHQGWNRRLSLALCTNGRMPSSLEMT